MLTFRLNYIELMVDINRSLLVSYKEMLNFQNYYTFLFVNKIICFFQERFLIIYKIPTRTNFRNQ